MATATAGAVATIPIPQSLVIHGPASDRDQINRGMEAWFAPRAALLSDNRPETRIQSPISRELHPAESLDWDASIEVAPIRVSGTLTVILEYGGRATPSPTRDPWD